MVWRFVGGGKYAFESKIWGWRRERTMDLHDIKWKWSFSSPRDVSTMTWMQWIGDIGEDQWGLLAVATLGLSVCHALLAAYFLGI